MRIKAQLENEKVLELRPNCECCNKELAPEAADAMICSFECTFCRDCAEGWLDGRYFTNKVEAFDVEMDNSSSELIDYFLKQGNRR